MSSIGSFESVFRRALRNRFVHEPVSIKTVLVIADLDAEAEADFLKLIQQYLQPTLADFTIKTIGKKQFAPWPQLRSQIDQIQPDLIISYRLLWVEDITAQKSLGSYIDLLSQDTDYPLLIMPHPALHNLNNLLTHPGAVLVATEHQYDDHNLVNYALAFVEKEAPLILVHIEDVDTYNYYLEAIGKIPSIDTEEARESIQKTLLEAPEHYAESVAEVLKESHPDFKLETVIEFGHLVSAYRNLLAEHPTDLLVTNTKDDTQLAMHSIGYSLAVEFRETPVLLL